MTPLDMISDERFKKKLWGEWNLREAMIFEIKESLKKKGLPEHLIKKEILERLRNR